MNRSIQMSRFGSFAGAVFAAVAWFGGAAQAETQYSAGSFTWDNGTTPAWGVSSGPYSSVWTAENDAVFEGTAGTVSIAAAGVTAHNLTFTSNGYIIQNNTLTLSGATPTISADLTCAISSVIDGSAGLAKTGAGTLTLSGANTYSGGTVLSGGLLLVNNSRALGTGPVTLNASAKNLRLGAGVTFTNDVTINGGIYPGGGHAAIEPVSTSSAATLSNGTITVNSAAYPVLANYNGQSLFTCMSPIVSSLSFMVRIGPVVLGGGGSYPGINFAEATVLLGADNGVATNAIVTIGGSGTLNTPTFDLAGYNQTLVGVKHNGLFLATITNSSSARVSTLTTTGTSDYTGKIAGNLALGVKGGVLTLSGTNTYGGGTTVSGGTLTANNNAAFGTNSVTLNPEATRLVINDGITVGNNITINSGTPGAGHGLIENSGTGNAVLSGGTITVTAATADGGLFRSVSTGTLTIADPIIASVAVGCRNGTVIFGGGGSYSTFIISQGTGRLGADNGLSTSAKLDLGNAVSASTIAIFDLAGYHQTLVGITRNEPTSSAIIGNSSTSSDSLLIVTGTSTYPGVIQNTLDSGTRKVALSVNGGTLTLSGTNTYTGATTVLSGTLSLTQPQALSEGTDVTVTAGAKIDLAFTGTNTIGSLTVDGVWLPANKVYGADKFPAALEGAGYFRTTTGAPAKGTLIQLN